MINIDEYLKNPCGALSIPYWKAEKIVVPDNMRIVHDHEYNPTNYLQYADEPYFRLKHDLKHMPTPTLPDGYALHSASLQEYSNHIRHCYDDMSVTECELHHYTTRRVFAPSLWLAIKETETGEVVATGIAELDIECREGILEWIQISPKHRHRGLGTYIVSELLHRMKGKADFCTVSGMCNNHNDPKSLYHKCGFLGNDIWHVLKLNK